jgi:hypothetical protein
MTAACCIEWNPGHITASIKRVRTDFKLIVMSCKSLGEKKKSLGKKLYFYGEVGDPRGNSMKKLGILDDPP